MAIHLGARPLLTLCLMLTGWLALFGYGQAAYAVNDKGVIVIDRDDYRARLAKDIYYLEDAEGTATLDDIREAAARGAFSRFRNDTLQFGYSNSTYWLKFTVENRLTERVGESPADRFFLSVRYPLLDDVRFYSVHASPYGTRVNEQTLGDLRAFPERMFRASDLIFPFSLAPGARAEIFLKVSSESSLSLPIYLEPERSFVSSRFNIDVLDGIYLGITIGLCLYNFFLWIGVRQRSYFYYVVFVSVYLVFNATMSGHTFRFWPTAIGFQQIAIYFFSIGSALAVALFGMEFLKTRKHLPRLHQLLRGYIVLCCLGLLATFVLEVHVAAKLNVFLTLSGSLLLFAAAIVRIVQHSRPAYYYLIGQGAVLLGVLFTILTSSNILPYYYIAPDVLKWAGAFEMLFFSIGLADLINDLKFQQVRAAAETEVAKAESRARQTYIQQLDQSNQELAEALKSRSEFLANMSHEIRTPMNGVLGMLDLVEDANLQPSQKQQLEIARRSGQTLLALINDILDLSKIESGKLELEQQPFNLQDFLQDLQQLYGKQLRDKQLSFTLHLDPEIPVWIEGDRTRLWQILTNLVSNAIKFTHQGGITVALTIVTQADAELLQIEVRDTGIGIPPEAQAKIFDSFSQADGSTTRKYGGTGLGLTIAQNLVKIMGGRITVTSEVGKGSAFAFAFPLRRAASQTAPVSENNGEHNAVFLSHLRVLVAEDNAVNRQVVQGMLKSLGITLVELVEDGSHAVDLLQRQPFDVILMDVQMPVMDGYEATHRIRALEDTAKAAIPIIALTASASNEERKRAHDEGMNDYLTKPMQRTALRDALRKYAEMSTDTAAEPIRASAG